METTQQTCNYFERSLTRLPKFTEYKAGTIVVCNVMLYSGNKETMWYQTPAAVLSKSVDNRMFVILHTLSLEFDRPKGVPAANRYMTTQGILDIYDHDNLIIFR